MPQVFADIGRRSLRAADIRVGQAVTPMEIELTHTIVAATAIATRDFMPVHHDKDYALSRSAPDVFLNILSTNGFVARFLTDWAGPEAWVRKISVRLGVPAVPHRTLRFTGEVLSVTQQGDECVIEVSVRAATRDGDHATGSAVITLPAME